MEDTVLPDWCLAGGFLTCFSLGCWCVPCGHRMTCSLGAKSLNPALHVHSSPLPWKELWLLLTLPFRALLLQSDFLIGISCFLRNLLLCMMVWWFISLWSSMKFWLILFSAWWFKSPPVTSSAIWLCSLFWKLSMIHKDARRTKVRQACLCCD